MTTLITILAWTLIFILCWPLAVLALLAWPIVWLLLIPFRLLGIGVAGILALVQAIVFLPARVLGWRPT